MSSEGLDPKSRRKFEIDQRYALQNARPLRDALSNREGIDVHRQRTGDWGRANLPAELVEGKSEVISPCRRRTIRDIFQSSGLPKSTNFRKLSELGGRALCNMGEAVLDHGTQGGPAPLDHGSHHPLWPKFPNHGLPPYPKLGQEMAYSRS